MTLFVGQEREREEFRQLLRKKTASLVVFQGRRRIGKSTFVHKYAEEADRFLFSEGLPPRQNIGRQNQLDAFAQQLSGHEIRNRRLSGCLGGLASGF